MPALTGGVASRRAETSYVDFSGEVLSLIENDLPITATDAQIAAFQDAMGDLSNAAIFKQTAENVTAIVITDATALDEAESSVTTVATMRFQSLTTLEMREFPIPAPDMSAIYWTGDYLKPRTMNTYVDAAVVAILALLGTDWLYIGSAISTHEIEVDTSTGVVDEPVDESGLMELFEMPFTYASPSPLILLTVPALATITSVRIHIETAFNVPSTITVGDAVVPDRLMAAADSNPVEIGVYELEPDYEYADITTLQMSINAPGATAGAGRIVLEYDKE